MPRPIVDSDDAPLRARAQSLVVEVASNDGYLLQYVQARGIPCLGIEPTASTAQAARDKGIEIARKLLRRRPRREAGRARAARPT